jgi:hypothetical protein
MRARLTEQYDVTLSKREMDELMLALRTYVREFEASELAGELLEGLEEVYQGGGAGLGISWPETTEDDDDEAGDGDEPKVV